MTKEAINLRQVFLPYRDIVRQQEGWQFGLPVKGRFSGHKEQFRDAASLRILLLDKDGTWREKTPRITPFAPHMTSESREVPKPHWAWAPIDVDGEVHYARVTPPKRGRGVMPLKQMKKSTFYLGSGIEEPTLFDMPTAIPTNLPPGRHVLKLGETELAKCAVSSGHVTAIEPYPVCYEKELWTIHLVRAALTSL